MPNSLLAPRFTASADRLDRDCLEHIIARIAPRSLDPNTRVGAMIVSRSGAILMEGVNQLPRGMGWTDDIRSDRYLKNQLIIHAELDALVSCARDGISVEGATLYLAATDDSGMIWGGPPCVRCTTHALHAGIKRIVSYPIKAVPSRWHEDLAFARMLLERAEDRGVRYREIPLG